MDNILDHILVSTDAKATGPDKWMGHGCCHGSKRNRDFSVRTTNDRILLHCFAGCTLNDICESMGIKPKDLFYDSGLPHSHRPVPKPPRINRVAQAFRFELAALDHRLRAERVHEAAKGINLSTLSDGELDRVLSHVAQAYAEQNRADLFEGIADTLRARDITERISRERQARAA